MAAGSTLGFALIAWVATAGSVQIFAGSTRTASTPQLTRQTPELRPRPNGTVTQTPPPASSVLHRPDLTWVGDVLSVLLASAVLIGVALLARWAWRRRSRRLHQPPEVPFDVLPEVSVALAADASAQFAALEEGSPRNAIVACWLRLEEIAGEAGLPSDPAETSAEFTTRVLGALAFDPAMIKGFAGLYREARFSRHELGEPARRAAVAALRSLHDDIAVSRVPISPDVHAEEAW
jgi:hypothetical protein